MSSPAGPAPLADDGAVADRGRLDADLSPSRSARDAEGEVGRWISGTAEARATEGLKVRLGLAYGPAARQRLDVFEAPDVPVPPPGRPVLVFIHGGFWQEGDIDGAGFAAPVFARAGWLFVSVGYTLAPAASLGQIIGEIRAALTEVRRAVADWGGDPARIVVAGHSAGGHLAACLACGIDGSLAGLAADDEDALQPAGLLLISGVFDLRPIARSIVNDAVRMSADEARAWSPALRQPLPRRPPLPVHVVVGAAEPAEFLRQSRLLAERWRDAVALTITVLPDRDHFDVLAAALRPERVPAQPDS